MRRIVTWTARSPPSSCSAWRRPSTHSAAGGSREPGGRGRSRRRRRPDRGRRRSGRSSRRPPTCGERGCRKEGSSTGTSVCSVSVLTLPDLAERPLRGPDPCRFAWARGRWVETPDLRTDTSIGAIAGAAGFVCWRGPPWEHDLYARARGCWTAWKPDGTVTFIRDGEVRRLVPLSRRRARSASPVLGAGAHARRARTPAAGTADGPPSSRGSRSSRWLDDERFAAILEQRTPDGVRRPSDGAAREQPWPRTTSSAGSSGARPEAGWLPPRPGREGFVAVDREGRLIPLAARTTAAVSRGRPTRTGSPRRRSAAST